MRPLNPVEVRETGFVHGFVELPPVVVPAPEVVVGHHQVRVELDGFAELGDGFVVLPLVEKRLSKVAMGDREVRVELFFPDSPVPHTWTVTLLAPITAHSVREHVRITVAKSTIYSNLATQ